MTDRTTTEPRREGGKWALSGFFYQTVGVAGVVARAHNRHEQGLDGDGLDALVEIFGLVPESFYDQDAALIPLNGMNEGSCAFYQFKYAQSTNTTKLTSPAFLDIVAAFVKGTRGSLSAGRTVFKYVLLTNRVVSAPVLKWIEDRALPGDKVTKAVRLVYGNAGQPIPATDQTIISAEVAAVMRFFDPPVQLATLSHFWSELTSYGERLGLSRELIYGGIRNLIATQVINGAEGVGDSIDRSVLNRAFCGCDDPHELTVEQIKESYSPEALETFCLAPAIGNPAIRQNVESWLAERIEERCPFFVLTGAGGMGKSTTLARWIDQDLGARDGIILFAEHASRLKRGWLGEKVHGWSRIPWLNNIGAGAAIHRLKSANQGREILIVIVVDGLDEIGTDHGSELSIAISELQELQEAREPLCIIASSRSDQPLRSMFKTPPKEFGGEVGLPFYHVGEFDQDEFESLVNAMETSEAKQRLHQSISPQMGGVGYSVEGIVSSSYISSDTIGSSPSQDVDGEILNCLHIPVVWGAFVRLEAEKQNMFLGKAIEAQREVGTKLVAWFYWKQNYRTGSDVIDELDLQVVLSKVANETGSHKFHNRSLWIDNAIVILTDTARSSHLYREAGSAGLIHLTEDGRQWRWASPIIRECIASLIQVSS